MPILNTSTVFMRPDSERWNLYASSTFTVENPALAIQNRRPGVFARSTDTTSGTPTFIRLDPTVVGAIDPDLVATYIGFVRHNGTAGTLLYRVRVSTAADFSGGIVYDSGAPGVAVDEPFADRGFVHIFDNPAEHSTGGPYAAGRYLEISLWATSASYIDIGVAFMGTPYQPARNMRQGNFVEPSATERVSVVSGSQGQEFPKSGIIYDVASGMFFFSSIDDLKAGWADLAEKVGMSGQLVFILDPTEITYRQQQFVYGRFTGLGRQRQVSERLYQVPFAIEGYH